MIAVNDPGSTRLVYAMVIGLVVVGVALVLLAVWLVRQTRYDPPVLAPLERMGDDNWRTSDPATQRRILDEVRPEGAEPLATGTAPPTLDDQFEAHDRPLPAFDYLRPGLSSEPEPTPLSDPSAGDGHPTDEPDDTDEPVDTDEPIDVAEPIDVEEPVDVEESYDNADR